MISSCFDRNTLFSASLPRSAILSWYTDNHRYISKSNRTLVEDLALSKYLSGLLDFLLSEHAALEAFIRQCDIARASDPDLILQKPNIGELLSGRVRPLSDDLWDWMHSEYVHSTSHPEKLIIPTVTGHMVRSKSESMICSVLNSRGIPFRYEEVISLGNETFAPDFIARNIRTGEFKYWEHLGLLDRSSYRHDNFEKLETYSRHGIYPNINLIITSETQDHPLNEPFINKMVDLFLI